MTHDPCDAAILAAASDRTMRQVLSSSWADTYMMAVGADEVDAIRRAIECADQARAWSLDVDIPAVKRPWWGRGPLRKLARRRMEAAAEGARRVAEDRLDTLRLRGDSLLTASAMLSEALARAQEAADNLTRQAAVTPPAQRPMICDRLTVVEEAKVVGAQALAAVESSLDQTIHAKSAVRLMLTSSELLDPAA